MDVAYFDNIGVGVPAQIKLNDGSNLASNVTEVLVRIKNPNRKKAGSTCGGVAMVRIYGPNALSWTRVARSCGSTGRSWTQIELAVLRF